MKVIKKIFKYSAILGTLGALLLPIYGCPDFPSTVSEGVASNPVTLFGKVIDSQTRQGIGDAKVYLKVNGVWKSTTTDSSTDTNAGDDTVGDFLFKGLPENTAIAYVIEGPTATGSVAYLKAKGTWTTPSQTTLNSAISFDSGQTSMEVGIKVTVRVVDSSTGNYISKVDSSANALSIPIYRGFPSANSVEADIATQDATDTDKYTINIPQTGTSTLTVATLDSDGDGDYDYQSGTRTINTSGGVTSGAGELTTSIVLDPVTPATALSVIASNVQLDPSGAGFIGASEATTNGIKYFFNMPISALPTTGEDAVYLSYVDNFKNLTAGAVRAEVAVSAALSGDNTLLSITPSSALTENQTYTVTGIVARGVDGAESNLNAAAGALGTVYVYATGAGSIGDTSPSITVDNANYWTDDGTSVAVITTGDTVTFAASSPGVPQLIFPEKVWGTVNLVSYPSVEVVEDSSNVALSGSIQCFQTGVIRATGTLITGILTYTSQSSTVTTSTTFTGQLVATNVIVAPDGSVYTVASIDTATSLTLTSAYGSSSVISPNSTWLQGTLVLGSLAADDVLTVYGTLAASERLHKVTAASTTSITVSPALDAAAVGACPANATGLRRLTRTYPATTSAAITAPAITYYVNAASSDATVANNNTGLKRATGGYYLTGDLGTFFGLGGNFLDMPDNSTDIGLTIEMEGYVTDADGNDYQVESAFAID